MKRWLVAALPAAASLVFAPTAWAHAVCGDRVFPATLTMDDPGVGDELSLPTVQYAPIPNSAGGGSGTTYGYEWDKTITEHFGISVAGSYVTQRSGGASIKGWDNIEVGLKDEFYCSNANEFMASIGVSREFAGTGSSSVTAGSISSTSPNFFFGKGLGDLQVGYLRPLAITGTLGYAISDSPSAQPNEWDYALSLQYSIPYLQQHVKDLGLPGYIAGLTPLVEVSLSTPRGQPTTGIVSPGFLYDADTYQLGIEAKIPINAVTRQSQGIGFIAQVHFFLDDIFPKSLGKPIF